MLGYGPDGWAKLIERRVKRAEAALAAKPAAAPASTGAVAGAAAANGGGGSGGAGESAAAKKKKKKVRLCECVVFALVDMCYLCVARRARRRAGAVRRRIDWSKGVATVLCVAACVWVCVFACHCFLLVGLMAFTAFCAASSKLLAGMMLRPLSLSICLPFSTLVPVHVHVSVRDKWTTV